MSQVQFISLVEILRKHCKLIITLLVVPLVTNVISLSDETILKIYDGEVADPKLCKNIAIPRTAQVSNVLVSE